jgi:hypothetical protein
MQSGWMNELARRTRPTRNIARVFAPVAASAYWLGRYAELLWHALHHWMV